MRIFFEVLSRWLSIKTESFRLRWTQLHGRTRSNMDSSTGFPRSNWISINEQQKIHFLILE